MKHTKLITGGLAALASAALVVGSSLPAHAEPVRPYAAAGSDTTQDVWNGLTNDGGPLSSIANYDAFDGSGVANDNQLIKTKTAGVWLVRPSGSGNGVRALSGAWDPANRVWKGKQLLNEEIDFARSSSGPSGANADLNYIPFARDAVSIAYNTTTGLTNLNLTTGQIKELYTGVDDEADSVVTFSGGLPLVNGTAVQPKIPQQGSGTRSFFISAAGLTGLALGSYISDPAGAAGLPENSVAAIPNGGDLIPFSAAQWIGQNNGASNATGSFANAALASINGQVPTNGTAPNLTPGALFGARVGTSYNTVPVPGAGTFNRDTYNVIPAAFRSGTATAKQANLVSSLTGGLNGSAAKTIINRYGFGTLGYLTTPSTYRTGSFQH
ncbi:substrate-binding domain-containing protein [Nocardioides sp.]|uniref:substrate-binding domain-containing protein n=1 Tax=Nocardioides sp. TaxID=35761 RepID=UPI0035124730